jgi:hypothetical protein
VTYVEVEKGQSGKGIDEMPLGEEPYRDAGARAGGARARDEEIVTDGDDESEAADGQFDLEGVVDLWVDEGKKTLWRLWSWLTGDRGLLREHPADIADLATYWVRSPMAGNSSGLRWVQRIHGFTFGLIGTAVGYAFAWLCQRPLRTICFLLLSFIVWRY